jgi:hypothetical protein
MPREPLVEEFHYFLEHQEDLVARHQGKVLAIRGQEVVGVFDTYLEALSTMSAKYPLGTFLLQKAEPGPEAYTQHFHSRVAFG